MSEKMSNARKYEISYTVLTWVVNRLSVPLGGLEREVGNIAKATGLDRGVINIFMTRGLIVDLLGMPEEMEKTKKHKIAYQVLMYFARYKMQVKLGDLKRDIGNLSRATGISKKELNEFMMELLRDVLRIELEDESILAELQI